MGRKFAIGNGHLPIHEIVEILDANNQIDLDESAVVAVSKCRAFLEHKLSSGDELFYGINTGFGSQYNVRIENDEVHALQHNLILSHAAGAGDPIDWEVSKAMILLKIISLCKGHSAVRLTLVERLSAYFNHRLFPEILSMGSLGASGDLAPLAHMSLTLLGLGTFRTREEVIDAKTALGRVGIQPLSLEEKEGIALINGTQFSLAHGVLAWRDASSLLENAHKIAALSLVAFNCNLSPFHRLIQTARGHRGQIAVAQSVLDLLNGHRTTEVQLQDPYSFRCIPQVHGAVWDALEYTGQKLEIEANAVTDNPIVFPDEDEIISGGNFHAQPIAFILDHMAVAVSGLANISERRTYKLLSGTRGIKPCLVEDPGLNSGLMIAQYTAASVVNRNKVLCYPASADSIPSSMGQEDHVSMAANSATKLREIVRNTEIVLAIELICAVQALELTGRMASLPPQLMAFVTEFRQSVPYIKDDVIISDLVENARVFIRKGN